MILTGELDVLRPGYLLSHVAPACDRDRRIILAMENQSRHLDRRQEVAGIIFVVSSKQCEDTPRTRCGALEPAKPLDEGFVLAHARRIDGDEDALAPVRIHCGQE